MEAKRLQKDPERKIMMKLPSYPHISPKATGRRLRYLCRAAGYTVHDLQAYCHLSNPQSVYKWFSGSTLPTLDNLYALSVLLDVPMNDIIVSKDDDIVFLLELSLLNISWIERNINVIYF